MSAPSKEDQRAYLRRQVGHGEDTALISDALLDDCLEQSLAQINQTFPLEGVTSFKTVADQQNYSPLTGAQYAIKTVYYPYGCVNQVYPEGFGNFFQLLNTSEVIDEFGTRRIYEPSLIVGFYQQLEFFQRLYSNGAYKLNETTVYLDPIPGASDVDVFYTFYEERFSAVDVVDANHLQPYYAYALCQLHQALAVGRGALSSVNSAGGVSMTTKASQHHLTMADRMLDRFESFRPVLKPGRHWQ